MCTPCAGYADHGGALKAEYEDDGRLSWPGYDFEADIERLWREVRPLYEQLHAYTRRRLMAAYPTQAFPQTGHIPAHLLGESPNPGWQRPGNRISQLGESVNPRPGWESPRTHSPAVRVPEPTPQLGASLARCSSSTEIVPDSQPNDCS